MLSTENLTSVYQTFIETGQHPAFRLTASSWHHLYILMKKIMKIADLDCKVGKLMHTMLATQILVVVFFLLWQVCNPFQGTEWGGRSPPNPPVNECQRRFDVILLVCWIFRFHILLFSFFIFFVPYHCDIPYYCIGNRSVGGRKSISWGLPPPNPR